MAKAQTIVIPAPEVSVNSLFDVAENFAPDIVSTKKGQRVSLIVSYEVISKTKGYTILRANHLSLKPSRRKF